MQNSTTINLNVDANVKEQASEILASLGLTLGEAFNLMLHQIRIVRGLPFEIKQRVPIELNDGHGSYICEFGHVHDYSKLDLDDAGIVNAKIYDTPDELWADLDDDDNEV